MKCNSNQKWSNDKSQCECENQKKNIMCARKVIFRILVLVLVKMVNMSEVLLLIQQLLVMKL